MVRRQSGLVPPIHGFERRFHMSREQRRIEERRRETALVEPFLDNLEPLGMKSQFYRALLILFTGPCNQLGKSQHGEQACRNPPSKRLPEQRKQRQASPEGVLAVVCAL